MERESFEDEEVARLLNDAFVCVKVDREERPDIDGIYMTACQLMTGRGGWPLTIFLTPEAKPFFAATYLPKRGRMGQQGLMELVPAVSEAWDDRREEVQSSAERLTGRVRQMDLSQGEVPLNEGLLESAYQRLSGQFDEGRGGFGGAPKFPTPHHGLFLLRYWRRTGEDHALEIVTRTLDAMRRGGVFDHIGYGFHRYSTDAEWRLPHFEKMLYDQAMLLLLHVETYQATQAQRFARTAREICSYVLRDLTSPEGGFYCAEDADSEGREGKFYLWREEEVREVLGAEDAELFLDLYQFSGEGNFVDEAARERTGENIPHLGASLETEAERREMSVEQLQQRVEAMRKSLFEAREERVRPALDDKMITDWNGLMLGAMARAGRVLDETRYVDAARSSAAFIESRLTTPDGRLVHRYRNGDAGMQANLDDYAFYGWGLTELYEATHDPQWLERASALSDHMIEQFWDEGEGGFFFTPEHGETLIARRKESFDAAIPSGNAVATWMLLRLARMTGGFALEEKADALLSAFSGQIQQRPTGFTALLCGLDFALGPAREVVLVGDSEEDSKAFIEVLLSDYHPNMVTLYKLGTRDTALLSSLAPFVEEYSAQNGQPSAYVCEQQSCRAPTADPEELRRLLLN